jgi:two-component system, cell cycle sensor histidine kinase and response regulator CckA
MNGRILIVEDEALVALDLRQALEEFGLEVVGMAASADDALAVVENAQPDLALMDINIRGTINGIQTARILHDPFGVPAVFLTSYGDDMTMEKATRESPYGYLLKPFNPRELKATLQIALNNARVDSDLRRLNRTLTAAVNGAFEALFMISITGHVQFMNRAAEELTGALRSQVIGQSIFNVLDLQDQSGRPALFPHLAKEHSIESFGLSLKTTTGKIVLVDLTISALLDDNGGLKRYVISMRDAEKRLSVAESTRLDAFDLISVPMLQLDGNGHILRVNQALTRETGIASESLVGNTLTNLSHDPDPQIANVLIPKLQGAITLQDVHPRLRNLDGSLLAGETSQWQKAEGSPPWPL